MKKQEIVWYSVKDDGMPTPEIIERTKGRFLCSVKTAYLKDESITATNTVAAFIEKRRVCKHIVSEVEHFFVCSLYCKSGSVGRNADIRIKKE